LSLAYGAAHIVFCSIIFPLILQRVQHKTPQVGAQVGFEITGISPAVAASDQHLAALMSE